MFEWIKSSPSAIGPVPGHQAKARDIATAVLCAAVLLAGDIASAQQFPGLVVATPPQNLPAPQPPAAAPAVAAAPKQVAKPKPKTVAAAKETTGDAGAPAAEAPAKGSGERIIMLVNDEPITSRDVDQRARFLSAGANVGPQAAETFKRLATSEATNTRFRGIVEEIVKQNQGKSREQIMAIIEKRKLEFAQGLQKQAMESARSSSVPKHRKDALEEIIEEKLKLQEARKLSVDVTDDEANRVIAGIAQRNGQTEAQFAQNLRGMGVDVSTMRARFRAGFAWRDVIRKKFAAQIQISEKDVERLVAATPGAKGPADTQEFAIQRIIFALPGKLDQAAMARALADADGIKRKFGGCKSMETLVKDQPAAKFEASKYVRPSTIAEPTRSMMLGAKDGDMLPPQTATDGVELIAVCNRRALQIDDKTREEATQELQSRKFEELAKRYLRDLRQDAHIENRG